MAKARWPTKHLSIASLSLDKKNPRLSREAGVNTPSEIAQYLFDHDKAFDIARSIVKNGYFASEPLLAIHEGSRCVVVEGNRRLAALKALKDPGFLPNARVRGKVEKLAQGVDLATTVPVVIAPNRRATDRLLAGRHIGTSVLPWQAENRASFILDKLQQGYSRESLFDGFGFTGSDIQDARQTRAIADMARSLDLPEDIRAKLDSPRTRVFTTLKRVFDSDVGQRFLKVKPDPEHGLRGTTTKKSFLRGFTQLVTDVASGQETSRSLNTNHDIREYFKRNPGSVPEQKQGSFVPDDVVQQRSAASVQRKKPKPQPPRKPVSSTVVPRRGFTVRYGSDRLKAICQELKKLRRDKFPNAGAVMLRVFLELAIKDYLKRVGRWEPLVKELKTRNKLPKYGPTLKQVSQEIIRVAKPQLSQGEVERVERGLSHDRSSILSVSELNAFVHSPDSPVADTLKQFWDRTEPLFRMMLEEEPRGPEK